MITATKTTSGLVLRALLAGLALVALPLACTSPYFPSKALVHLGTVALSDAELVAADKSILALGFAAGDSSSTVAQNLVLTTSTANGSTVTWSSSPTGLIAADGCVTCRLATTAVTLTATISRGEAVETTTFAVTVLGKSAALRVADDRAALVDPSILGSNGSLSSLVTNLFLPSTGADGSAISWSSSATAVVGNDGVVTRPDAQDATVTLSATISVGGSSATKSFILTVKATGSSGISVSLPGLPGAADLVFTNAADAAVASFTVARGGSFTVKTGFVADSYAWTIDGGALPSSTGSTCVVATTALGTHSLLLDVGAGGKFYSGTIQYTVVMP